MSIIQAWGNSLRIFIPSNLKLFGLVTLKSIVRVYALLFRQLWWLLLSGVVLTSVAPALSLYIVHPLIMLAMYCIARPSVGPKGYSYYMSRLRHGAWLLPVLIGITGIGRHIAVPDEVFFFLSTTVIFLFLFVLDSYAQPKDVMACAVRAVKMVIFNFPFCVIATGSFSFAFRLLLNWCIYPMFELVLDQVAIPAFLWGSYIANTQYLLLLLFPIPLCFFTNFYIKKMHEQFVLYYS